MECKKIVLIQTTLAHYYPARLLALAQHCQREGFMFDNIELSGSISVYPWFQTTIHSGFSNISLFPDSQFEKIPEEKMWRALEECLKKLNPDVVFLFGYSLGIMRKAKTWCERKKIPTVLISVSNQFDKKRFLPREFLKYFFVRRFDAAFVAGESAKTYIKKLGISEDRIAVGCDVLDVQAISKQAQHNQKDIRQIREKWNLPLKYFLFVGRLIPEKNVIGLLSAFVKSLEDDKSNNDWDLVICGSGVEQEKIDSFLQNIHSKFRPRVRLYGFVGPDDMVDFYSGASFFILPSISEPWGLVVNEAMACELPIIVSQRVGASFDLVRNGENGWIIDPFDIQQMAKVLNHAANLDENTRQEFGRRSRTLINHWDLDRFSQGIIESARMALAHAEKKYKG